MQNPNQGAAYTKAQEALQPVDNALQVDEAMGALREAAEFNAETVRALLRRLEPVLNPMCFTFSIGAPYMRRTATASAPRMSA